MNISQAKEIPLHIVVEDLGGKYAHTRKGELWYYSPFRPNERTASFVVNEKTGRWIDYGLAASMNGNNGDILDLWCDYHKIDRKGGLKDALVALERYSNIPTSQHLKPSRTANKTASQHPGQEQQTEPRFQIVKLHDRIYFPQIKAELQRRRISLEVANLYLKQVYLKDTENPDRNLNGLAFPNSKGGYEISIPNPATGKAFKTSTRPKAPSFIKGEDSTRIEIFEGFWDFQSLLEMQKRKVPQFDTYVLNSVVFAADVIEVIKQFWDNITSVILYIDNDDARIFNGLGNATTSD